MHQGFCWINNGVADEAASDVVALDRPCPPSPAAPLSPAMISSFPTALPKLVQAWLEIHREDLMADWKLAIAGQPVMRIKPLE